MGVVCKTATDSRFRVVGMSVQDSSHDCEAVSLTCITTEGTWECSTSSSQANMLAKPTVHNSWAGVSASGKPEPYANMTSSKLKSLVNTGCPFVLVFRTKHARHSLAGAPKV